MTRKDSDHRGPSNFLFGLHVRKSRQTHSPRGSPASEVQPHMQPGLRCHQHHAMQTKAPGTFGMPPVDTGAPSSMRPFNHLASAVKQCPWVLGSDAHPFAAHETSGDFYPSIPRGLMHDTAISLLLTDHSHPEKPKFVISCPLEHVGFIQRLLAPEGSRRQLTARGSSGHPRGGDQLKSMLLDGTSNIELAIHSLNDEQGIFYGGEQPCRLKGSPAQWRGWDPYWAPHPFAEEPFCVSNESTHRSQATTESYTSDANPECYPMAWIPGLPVPAPEWYSGPRNRGVPRGSHAFPGP